MASFDGYTYETTVNVDEVCRTVYDPRGPINQELDDRGVERANTTDALCVAVGIGAGALSSFVGPVGTATGFVIGTLGCQAGVYTCVIEDFATGLSGCGELELEIHVKDNIYFSPTGTMIGSPVLVAPTCSSGLSLEDIIDAIEAAGGTVLQEGSTLVDQLEDEGGDFVDDVKSGGKDILDQGAGLIGL